METQLTGILNFGKYRGKTINDVIDIEPSYLLWADKNIKELNLSKEVLYEVFDAMLEEQKEKINSERDVREENERQIDKAVTTIKGKEKLDHITNRFASSIGHMSKFDVNLIEEIDSPFWKDKNADGRAETEFFLNSLDDQELGDAMGFDNNEFGDH